jgi:hypothetical protein
MELHFKSETLTLRTQRDTYKSDGSMYVNLKVYLPYSVTSKAPCQTSNLHTGYVIYATSSGLSAASSVNDG